MNYVEFNSRPILEENSNGVSMVNKILNNQDKDWLMQGTDSVLRWACQGANGFVSAVISHIPEENRKPLNEQKIALETICAAVIEYINKDYDVTFERNVEKEKTVTVDVPKVRKIGLFRKEEYIDHETRVEKYTERETITYKGWRIERLYRKEGSNSSRSNNTIYFDYCLGADGQLYSVVSMDGISEPLIMKCICYPIFIQKPFCNVYTAAIGGVLGALDAIPLEQNDPIRNVHLKLDDDYYFNFPVQVDNESGIKYGFLTGTIERVINLLDEKGKSACCEKYGWMTNLIYPDQSVTTNTSENANNSTESMNEGRRAFNYEEYAEIGVREISRKPYARSVDEFATNPNGCFISAFLTERLTAADDLAKRFPEFRTLINKIFENQKNLTGDGLFEERRLGTDLANMSQDDSGDTFILLAAYNAFLSHGSDDEKTIALVNMMVDHACSFTIQRGGWQDIMMAVMLWFSDKDGYRERVINEYKTFKGKSMNETSIYTDKINMETYSRLGAQFYGQYDGQTDIRFISMLQQWKIPVAERIEKEYPSFSPVVEYLRSNYVAADLQEEFDEIYKNIDLLSKSIDYSVLLAAIGCFLDRTNPNRATSEDLIKCVENILNNPGEEIVGLPSIVMLCVALWFSDYKGYKERVYNQIIKLLDESYYSRDKSIDLMDVRTSIENSRFE